MHKKYRVTLTPEERLQLEALLGKGKAAARKLCRARILLKADATPAGPAWTDEHIAQALDVGLVTVYRVRQTFVEQGFEAVLSPRHKGRPRPRKIDGEQEARLIALTCSKPPPGRKRWTLRLLADKLVELGQAPKVSPETVRQVLKKTS
jgi:transposase